MTTKHQITGYRGRIPLLPLLFACVMALQSVVTAADKPAAPPPCQLHIITAPDDASVTVDGKLEGATPLTIPALKAGQHVVTINRRGYFEVQRSLELKSGERALIDIKLEQIMGLVLVHSEPDQADIIVDGIDMGRTPKRSSFRHG